MQAEPNPYQAPPTTDETSPAMPIEPSSLDFPGGLKTPAAIGLVGGLLVVLAALILGSRPNLNALVSTSLFAIWCGAFALVGWLLPGPNSRRTLRAVLMFFLSFPAVVLYVPVCAMTTIALSGGGAGEPALIFGSVVAFTSVLVLFAVIIRFRARRTAPYANPLPPSAPDPRAAESIDHPSHE